MFFNVCCLYDREDCLREICNKLLVCGGSSIPLHMALWRLPALCILYMLWLVHFVQSAQCTLCTKCTLCTFYKVCSVHFVMLNWPFQRKTGLNHFLFSQWVKQRNI